MVNISQKSTLTKVLPAREIYPPTFLSNQYLKNGQSPVMHIKILVPNFGVPENFRAKKLRLQQHSFWLQYKYLHNAASYYICQSETPTNRWTPS